MSDFVHLEKLMSLCCEPGSLKTKDVWLDSRMTQLKFFAVDDGRGGLKPLPSPLLRLKSNDVLEICRSAEELKKIESLASPSGLSFEMESRLFAQAGLKVPLSDDDGPMMNYTSLIQSNEPGLAVCYSAKEWLNKSVDSSTGRLGTIVDFIFDQSHWSLKFILVEDERLKGRQVLVDPEWIEGIEATKGQISVGLSREILLLEAIFDPRTDKKRRYQIDV